MIWIILLLFQAYLSYEKSDTIIFYSGPIKLRKKLEDKNLICSDIIKTQYH